MIHSFSGVLTDAEPRRVDALDPVPLLPHELALERVRTLREIAGERAACLVVLLQRIVHLDQPRDRLTTLGRLVALIAVPDEQRALAADRLQHAIARGHVELRIGRAVHLVEPLPGAIRIREGEVIQLPRLPSRRAAHRRPSTDAPRSPDSATPRRPRPCTRAPSRSARTTFPAGRRACRRASGRAAPRRPRAQCPSGRAASRRPTRARDRSNRESPGGSAAGRPEPCLRRTRQESPRVAAGRDAAPARAYRRPRSGCRGGSIWQAVREAPVSESGFWPARHGPFTQAMNFTIASSSLRPQRASGGASRSFLLSPADELLGQLAIESAVHRELAGEELPVGRREPLELAVRT